MKNNNNNPFGAKNILFLMVFFLLIVSVAHNIVIMKLYKDVKQDNERLEMGWDNSFKEKFKRQDFFKPYDFQNWDPLGEFQTMRERMERMFDDSHNRFKLSPFFDEEQQTKGMLPQTNLEEKDDRYIVTMNIPGSDKDEINVDLEGDTLTVSAKTKMSSIDKKFKSFLRMERSMGSFQRSVELPEPVDVGAMETKYEDGVLTIVLPKQK